MQDNNQAGNNANNDSKKGSQEQNNNQSAQDENLTQPDKGKEHSDEDHPHQEKTPVAKPGKK